MGPGVHLKEGWGLIFKEKVWSVPIVTLQVVSIIAAIAIVLLSALEPELRKNLLVFIPGAFVLGVGQSIAALMLRWAESNLDEPSKKGSGEGR